MAKNKIYAEGNVMPWTNGTGSDVSSGDPVEINTMVGVALGDIAAGDSGQIALSGVWELTKEAPLVISQGDKVYFDSTAGNCDKTDTNTYAGKAFAAAVSAATVVLVRLDN